MDDMTTPSNTTASRGHCYHTISACTSHQASRHTQGMHPDITQTHGSLRLYYNALTAGPVRTPVAGTGMSEAGSRNGQAPQWFRHPEESVDDRGDK